MRFIEKMKKKSADLSSHEGITLAFIGDSVTQGCFELYREDNGETGVVFDQKNGYTHKVADILAYLYPKVPINIINAGISGDRSVSARERVERDVLRHAPDITVVCFGLNECGRGEASIKSYVTGLGDIFDQLASVGSEIVYMSPNMKNTRISAGLLDTDVIHKMAEYGMQVQTDGTFDAHIDAARALCEKRHIPVCDCYALWKTLYASGVDTTELLSNRLNHPTREMHWMFAYELVKTFLQN